MDGLFSFQIRDGALFEKAFSHKSARGIRNSYEKLELLGDSVLSLVIIKYLIDLYPKLNEGELTKMKTRLVCKKTLATIAKHLGFGEHIRMNEFSRQRGFHENVSVLEDVFEAVIGAIYLDQGLPTARKFILDAFTDPNVLDWEKTLQDKNFKDQLMRYCQARAWPLPVYVQLPTSGGFRVEAVVGPSGDRLGEGTGSTLKAAEQGAACEAMIKLSSANVAPRVHQKNGHQLKRHENVDHSRARCALPFGQPEGNP